MKLNETEQQALREWLKHRSYRHAAEQLGVNFTSIGRWINGGGLHPSQYSALLKELQPYLPHDSSSHDLLPISIKPSLLPIYRKLCELEARAPSSLIIVDGLMEQLTHHWPQSPPPN